MYCKIAYFPAFCAEFIKKHANIYYTCMQASMEDNSKKAHLLKKWLTKTKKDTPKISSTLMPCTEVLYRSKLLSQ